MEVVQNKAFCSLQENQQQSMQAMCALLATDRAVLMELLKHQTSAPSPTPFQANIKLQKMGPEDKPKVLF